MKTDKQSAVEMKRTNDKRVLRKSSTRTKDKRVLRKSSTRTKDKRVLRKSYTCGIYCLDYDTANGKMFAPPFLSINDDVALDSIFELAKTHPELQNRNLYCLGTYCSVDGKILASKPRQVVRKESN